MWGFRKSKIKHLLKISPVYLKNWWIPSFIYLLLQVILFEIDCVIFFTNLHELFCQFISLTNWVNSGKFMDNCWISYQVMADMRKVYDDLIIINLYQSRVLRVEILCSACFRPVCNHSNRIFCYSCNKITKTWIQIFRQN